MWLSDKGICLTCVSFMFNSKLLGIGIKFWAEVGHIGHKFNPRTQEGEAWGLSVFEANMVYYLPCPSPARATQTLPQTKGNNKANIQQAWAGQKSIPLEPPAFEGRGKFKTCLAYISSWSPMYDTLDSIPNTVNKEANQKAWLCSRDKDLFAMCSSELLYYVYAARMGWSSWHYSIAGW